MNLGHGLLVAWGLLYEVAYCPPLDMLKYLQTGHFARSGNVESSEQEILRRRDRFSRSYAYWWHAKAGMEGGKRATYSTCALHRLPKHLHISRYLLVNRQKQLMSKTRNGGT